MERYLYDHRRRMFKGFHYLPILYLIPDEIAIKRGLADFPRDPYIAVTDDKWIDVYNSLNFQVLLMDTWAWMMWQCLGIRGGIDNYSKNDPFIRMVYDLPMWAWLLDEGGISIDLLAQYPHGMEIPFLTMEQAAFNCDRFAERFWEHPMLKMREVWEVVKKHRAHNDYSSMPSHVKQDFNRKFHHSRAFMKTVYVDGEDEEHTYSPWMPSDFEEAETRIWFEGFLKRLNEKDRQIVKLLERGYTQEEIGEMLGYANHSGVCKRIAYIKKEFEKFRYEE